MQFPSFILWRQGDRRYLALAAGLVVLLVAVLVAFYVVCTVGRVEGASMAPTLLPDERVLLTRGYGQPARGDIVDIATTEAGGVKGSMLKRVVALPGDTLRVVGDVAYVNGEESDVVPDAIVGGDTRVFFDGTVPDGAVYVLGDNRPVSLDSRFVGPVPLETIRGRVVAVISPVTRFRLVTPPPER